MVLDPRWHELLTTYEKYAAEPSLRSQPTTDEERKREKRLAAIRKLPAKVQSLIANGILDSDPSALKNTDTLWKLAEHAGVKTRNGGKTKEGSLWFRELWRAIVLHHCGYRCHYCKRNFLTTRVAGRVLRVELDHRAPRANGGANYCLDNIRAACRTCNVARGRMREEWFLEELRSLAGAIR